MKPQIFSFIVNYYVKYKVAQNISNLQITKTF